MNEPTETLMKVMARGLRALDDEELDHLARYVEIPPSDGDAVGQLGRGGWVMHLATRQEQQVRRGECLGNVLTCFAALAARWMLFEPQSAT